MPEPQEPFIGENDPPAPTMFERLCKRLRSEQQRYEVHDAITAMNLPVTVIDSASGETAFKGTEAEVEEWLLRRVIRAVLTELRKGDVNVNEAAARRLALVRGIDPDSKAWHGRPRWRNWEVEASAAVDGAIDAILGEAPRG